VKFYHGGIRGLKQGEKILPPSVTGNSTLLQYATEIAPDGPQRKDRIYLTTDKKAARLFASVVPRGDVYEVIPDSELEDDPDCSVPGISYQCTSATIKRVVELSVRM
jgi:hypothetical protein